MNQAADPFRRIRDLIEKALDNTLSHEEALQLEAMIADNAELRHYYCQYLHLTISLMRSCSGNLPATGEQQLDNLVISSLWDALRREEKTAPALDIPDETETVRSPVVIPPVKTVQPKISFTLPVIAAICLLGLFVVAALNVLYLNLVPQEVATLDKTFEAAFRQDRGLVGGTRLTSRRKTWTLETGLAEIRFDSGARVVLEGPASFRLLQGNRMSLIQGQIYAEVPPEAKGFSVRTPDSSVIDLGTEFGLKVATDGTSAVHMIKGKASFGLTGQRSNAHIVATGQARRMQSGGQISDIPIEEQTFVRRFNPETAFIWRGQGLSLAGWIGQDMLGTNAFGNTFQSIQDNPWIDGIFVPDGRSNQIVSSLGHRFEACPVTGGESDAVLYAKPEQGISIYDPFNTLTIRVVDPARQSSNAFVMAEQVYTVTGGEPGAELMPESQTDMLGTGTWVHFTLGTPVALEPNRTYGFDVTVSGGEVGYCFETAGMAEDVYAGGSAYTSGIESGTNSLQLDRIYNGDHTFIVELEPIDSAASLNHRPAVSYSIQPPNPGPFDIYSLRESSIDRDNVGGVSDQTQTVTNDHATYIARDRNGLGQTFTTGPDSNGYVITGFWLKHVKYQQNLTKGNGTSWYVGSQPRRELVQFNGQIYGSERNPCIVMHANLGVTFDLQTLRAYSPETPVTRFTCQAGMADFDTDLSGSMDFWVLVDGQVRASLTQVDQSGVLNDLSVDLQPTDRFLTLVTTDGGDPDHPGTFQKADTGDWGVFVEPLVFFD